MNLIIEAGTRKRCIEGPFNLCASSADFRRLRAALDVFIERGAAYGWISVVEVVELAGPMTEPEPWDSDTESQRRCEAASDGPCRAVCSWSSEPCNQGHQGHFGMHTNGDGRWGFDKAGVEYGDRSHG